jgi:HEAT repeat protein
MKGALISLGLPKNRQFLTRILLKFSFLAACVAVWAMEEPRYGGKSLDEWISEYLPKPGIGHVYDGLSPGARSHQLTAEQSKAEAAIRQIGTKAVPFLVQRVRDGHGSERASGFRSAFAFRALGPLATSAVPHLVKLADTPDPFVRNQALLALGNIGPEARSAVPVLIRLLNDGDVNAAVCLGNIGPDAAVALPQLMAKLRQGDPHGRTFVVTGIGKLGASARNAVPEIVAVIHDTESLLERDDAFEIYELRQCAVEALGNIGSKEGVPCLVQMLKQDFKGHIIDLYLKRAIMNSLASIGADAREAIPVLMELRQKYQNRLPELANAAHATMLAIDKAVAIKAGVE